MRRKLMFLYSSSLLMCLVSAGFIELEEEHDRFSWGTFKWRTRRTRRTWRTTLLLKGALGKNKILGKHDYSCVYIYAVASCCKLVIILMRLKSWFTMVKMLGKLKYTVTPLQQITWGR